MKNKKIILKIQKIKTQVIKINYQYFYLTPKIISRINKKAFQIRMCKMQPKIYYTILKQVGRNQAIRPEMIHLKNIVKYNPHQK